VKQEEGNSNNDLGPILAKAERTLKAAESALADGHFESAASRAYYAAFHAIQALLKSVGQTYSKHSGVMSAFHRDFIKTGIFSPEYGAALTRLSGHREIADYSYTWRLDPEEVKEDVQRAARIVKAIRECLELDGANAQPTEM